MSSTRLVPSLLVLAALGAAPAQTQLANFHLPGPFGDVGSRVASAGDFDGDGVLDALCAGNAVAAVFSGATGEQLAAVPLSMSSIFSSLLGVLSLPDIDGDGLRDFVVADGATARAISSADGHILWTLNGSAGGSIGWSMAVLEDLDGDGFPDLAIGEPDADPAGKSSAGSIWVLSGDNGALLHRIDGDSAQDQIGLGVDGGPDLNRDGHQDLFVSDTKFKVAAVQVGRVRIQSALDGALLRSIPNDAQDFNFARVLASGGDLDGDGLADVVVSAASGGVGIEAYSSSTAQLLWDDIAFPSALVSVGDVNGDGVPEMVAGFASFFISSSTRVLDGATGNLLGGFSADGGSSFTDLAPMGDTDGDGVPELLGTRAGQPPYSTQPPAGLHVALPDGELLHLLQNQHGDDRLGSVVDALGDTNGDGATDWLVASSNRMVVFSGADGSALVDVNPGLVGGISFLTSHAGCALGDVNGDGVTDVALANSNFAPALGADGRVRILSGTTGASLAVRDGPVGAAEAFGGHVAPTTDHNGDGIRDLYVTAMNKDWNGFQDAGEVDLVSGADLSTIVALHGLPQASGNFGQSVDTGADLNGDGVPEVAIGSAEEYPGQFQGGSLYILDGATHATIWRKDAALNAAYIFGALTPDLNADDVADFLSAEPNYLVPGETQPRGRVRAWSGATGLLLWEHLGPWPLSNLGTSLAAAGDANGDGFADVLATARPQVTDNAGSLLILSGTNGATIDQIVVDPGDSLSLGPAHSAGYFDAGGCSDVVVGVPGHKADGAAFVYASSQGGLHGFVDLGFAKLGSNGSQPSLRGYGDLSAGGLVTLTARHALPFKSCTWFVGLAQGNIPFKKGTLVPSPFGPFFSIGMVTDANGSASISAPNPSSVVAGLALYHQFWFSDPAATAKLSASNGMKEIFK